MRYVFELTNSITRWAKAKPTIRAALLTSTRAIRNAAVDPLSDYDVILIVDEVEINDNWQALEQTMTLFQQVAFEVGEASGYTYPDELHRRIATCVEQIRHKER